MGVSNKLNIIEIQTRIIETTLLILSLYQKRFSKFLFIWGIILTAIFSFITASFTLNKDLAILFVILSPILLLLSIVVTIIIKNKWKKESSSYINESIRIWRKRGLNEEKINELVTREMIMHDY